MKTVPSDHYKSTLLLMYTLEGGFFLCDVTDLIRTTVSPSVARKEQSLTMSHSVEQKPSG